MTLILKFLRFNDMIASIIGLSSNAMLIYLIFTVNKANMKQISRTLLQNCVLDMILATIILVGQPGIVTINGTYYNIVGSPLYVLGFPFASFIICSFGAALHLSILALPVPFYIRYLVLCKHTTVTMKDVIRPYLMVFAYIIPLYALCFWCCPMFSQEYVKWRGPLMTPFWLDEYKGGPVYVGNAPGDIRLKVVFLAMLLVTVISYTLVIYFSVQITRYLRNTNIQMSKRTKMLNKQLQLTLTIQAIGPLLTANLPTGCLLVMVLLQYENIFISLGCCSLLGWIAAINPVAAMLIITPYRNKIKSLLGLKDNNIYATTGTHSSANMSQNTRDKLAQTMTNNKHTTAISTVILDPELLEG